MQAIAMLGFGEAAKAFVGGWRDAAGSTGPISTYDIKYLGDGKPALEADCGRLDVRCGTSPRDGLRDAQTVFSLVTADRALEAAESAAAVIAPKSLFLDCNSCSPATKQAATRLIESAGGHYIDVAVMAPVHPQRHLTPLLLAGDRAADALELLNNLGMRATVVGTAPGQACAIKMLRSVMIKGFEALTAECMLAARRAGVEDAVLASLQASDPGFDWKSRSAYNLERMMVHGTRRAAEMQEVAATLRELGISDGMTNAAAEWQRRIAGMALPAGEDSLGDRADRILQRMAR